MNTYITNTESETVELGKNFAENLKIGDVIALTGDLGCGKTAFVKGVVSYFGNGGDVSSPTFTLVNEYDGSVPIYHFDIYRLENANPNELDWMDDYLFGDGISVIEWAEYAKSVLPENTVKIQFKKLSETKREITIL